MSAPDIATPASASMDLGDLLSNAAFKEEEEEEEEEVMNPEVAPPADVIPEALVKKVRKTPAKKAKAVTVAETGEDGEVISGDVGTETPVKVRKARKTPVKKEKAVVGNGENGEAVAGDADAEPTPTKVKKPRGPKKTPVKKENEKSKEDAAAKEGEDDAEVEQPTTPKKAIPKKRATPKKKTDAAPATPKTREGAENGDVDADIVTPTTNGATKTPASKSSTKKRASGKVADGETPTKKAKTAKVADGEASTKKGKTAAVPIPDCWAEFSEEDKLIVDMKKDKKHWKDIEIAWAAVTGTKPGDSVLRKRFGKLELVAQDFNDKDTARLVAAKKLVEADFIAIKQKMEKEQAAALKKLETDKWQTIAEKIKDAGGDDYTALLLLEKKYNALEKSGDIDNNGDFTGAVAEDAADEEAADDDAADEDAADEEVVNGEAADGEVVDGEVADDDMDNVNLDDEAPATNDDMDNVNLDDEAPATNGNGHIEEEEVDADAMVE